MLAGSQPEHERAEAIRRLWYERRDLILARVRRLGLAVVDLVRGELSDASREEAGAEAHRLAGILGTYGFPRGSELAGEIEQRLAGPAASSRQVNALAYLAMALQAVLEEAPRPEGEVESDPAAVPDADVPRWLAGETSVPPPPPGAGESILIVDDDEALLALVSTVLAGAGYAVTQASSGPRRWNGWRRPYRTSSCRT